MLRGSFRLLNNLALNKQVDCELQIEGSATVQAKCSPYSKHLPLDPQKVLVSFEGCSDLPPALAGVHHLYFYVPLEDDDANILRMAAARDLLGTLGVRTARFRRAMFRLANDGPERPVIVSEDVGELGDLFDVSDTAPLDLQNDKRIVRTKLWKDFFALTSLGNFDREYESGLNAMWLDHKSTIELVAIDTEDSYAFRTGSGFTTKLTTPLETEYRNLLLAHRRYQNSFIEGCQKTRSCDTELRQALADYLNGNAKQDADQFVKSLSINDSKF